MSQLAEQQTLRDIDTDRVYPLVALTRGRTSSASGTVYVTFSNDAVPSKDVVPWLSATQIRVFGDWGCGKTAFLRKLSDQSALMRLFEKLKALRRLEPDWNGYGSTPPNATAEAHARGILDELQRLNRIPERVVASADDGVGIYITSGKKYAMIECYNDGGIVIGVSDREGDIRNWEITTESLTIRTGLEEAIAFLDG